MILVKKQYHFFVKTFFNYTTFLGVLSRLLSATAQLFLIPLLIGHLGVSDFAIITIIFSLQVWFELLDWGFSTIFPAFLIEKRRQRVDFRITLKKLYLFLTVFLAIDALIILGLSHRIEKFVFSSYPDYPHGIISMTALVFLIYIFSNVIYRFYLSMRKLRVNYFYQIGSIILLFLSVFIYSRFSKNLYFLVLIWYGSQSVIPLLITCSLVKKIKGVSSPFHFKEWLHFTRKSLSAFLFTFFSAFIWGMDGILIAKFVKSEEQISYFFLYKLFSVMIFLFYSVFNVCYVDFAQNFHSKKTNVQGIANKAAELTVLIVFCTVGYAVVLCLLSSWISQIFLRGIVLPKLLIVGFAVFTLVRLVVDMQATILSACGKNFVLMMNTLLQLFISFPLMFFFVKTEGSMGILFGLTVSCVLVGFITLPITLRKILSCA